MIAKSRFISLVISVKQNKRIYVLLINFEQGESPLSHQHDKLFRFVHLLKVESSIGNIKNIHTNK